MEDLIAYTLIVAFVVAVVGVLYKVISNHRKEMRRLEDESAERSRLYRNRMKGTGFQPRNTVPPRKETYASSTSSSSTSTSDSFLSDIATLYVLNSALHHGSASAKVDYDTGTIKTDNASSPSWGLDDADTRKSVSNTFSDSTGGWGSSDSSSSSSDSGPSSDW